MVLHSKKAEHSWLKHCDSENWIIILLNDYKWSHLTICHWHMRSDFSRCINDHVSYPYSGTVHKNTRLQCGRWSGLITFRDHQEKMKVKHCSLCLLMRGSVNGSFIKALTALVNWFKKSFPKSRENKQTIEHVSVVVAIDVWFFVRVKDKLIRCSSLHHVHFHH